MRCYGCHVVKDPAALEVYPWDDEDNICDEPIPPLFVLEVQPTNPGAYRAVVVCFACFHVLDPDLWISQGMWEHLKPRVPFEHLPVSEGRRATDYPECVTD